MKIGKLSNDELEKLILNKFKKTRAEVETSPQIGMDCARVHIGDTCVLSSDPITGATEHIGYLTVHINCNDAAAAGAEPVGLMVTLLAPPSITKDELSAIADDIAQAAKAANVDILGGHTEITDAVTRVVTSATVIAKPITKVGGFALDGDDIIMTKVAGIEGSIVIASDNPQKLSLSDDGFKNVKNMINSLSVVPEGLFAAKNGANAMHDITEGGVLGAVWEMAYLSGLGCTVYTEKIPVSTETAKICKQLNLNPLRLLSSGSMLIACKDGEKMIGGLKGIGIDATIIAKMHKGDIIDSNGNIIAPPGADEIYKV